jgi:hypothetical protein
MANRPDTIKKKKDKTSTPIDVAVPADRAVTQKEAEKKLVYKILCKAVQRVWNTKSRITPVITEASGIAINGLKKNSEVTPGKHSVN